MPEQLVAAATDAAEDAASEEAAKIESALQELFDTNITASEVMQYAMSDVMKSYREIAVMCGSSLIISFIIILLLGWIAQIMIYAIAIGTAVACLAGPAYFWYVWYLAKEELDAATVQMQTQIENVETLMIYAIILSVSFCLVFNIDKALII